MVHQEVHEITRAATISGPLRPAANMKLKCPSSWLPRVKLTRLRFIGTSLAASGEEAELLAFAHVSLVRPAAQRRFYAINREALAGVAAWLTRMAKIES